VFAGDHDMTPAQLVKAVSLALDVPVETVATHDRNLVIAGLRTTGARGVNAPPMTHKDAARLFVAVLGSVRAKDSVDTVHAYEKAKHSAPDPSRRLRKYEKKIPRTKGELGALAEKMASEGGSFADAAIAALPAGHSFVQALEALIASACTPIDNMDDHIVRFSELIISCEAPSMRGHIQRRDGGASGYFNPSSKGRPAGRMLWSGLQHLQTVSGAAIMLLGKAFRDNGLPFETMLEAQSALVGPGYKVTEVRG
jgi:hypothetical protein